MTGYGIYLDTARQATRIWATHTTLTDLLNDLYSHTPHGAHFGGVVITTR